MHRRTFLPAVTVLAFIIGASLDYQLRRPGTIPDCSCTSAKCRSVFIAGYPLISQSHPVETFDSLRTARRID